jgi:hypothetical protein
VNELNLEADVLWLLTLVMLPILCRLEAAVLWNLCILLDSVMWCVSCCIVSMLN